jgi:hypothetical protein
MFGNKYSGDELAIEFLKAMQAKKISKVAQSQEMPGSTEGQATGMTIESEEDVSAEDFLDLNESEPEAIESDVDKEIEGLESFIDDKPIVAKSPLKDYAQNLAKQKAEESDAKDHIDDKTAYVLRGLGKIAGSLKARGENFAADVVEATALNIRKEALVKEAKKQKVLSTLNKIAKRIEQKGDVFSADVVRATMLKIKNASSYSDVEDSDYEDEGSDSGDSWIMSGIKKLIEDNKATLENMDLSERTDWVCSELVKAGFTEEHAAKICSELGSVLDFESADVTEEYDFSSVDFEDVDISDDLDFEEDMEEDYLEEDLEEDISDEDLFDYLGFNKE